MPHRHNWVEYDRIGIVVSERCSICGETRTRLREEK